MKHHTGMEAHDGYAPHSHEVRPDHLGIDRNGIIMPGGWAVYYDGELVFSTNDWEQVGAGVASIMEEGLIEESEGGR